MTGTHGSSGSARDGGPATAGPPARWRRGWRGAGLRSLTSLTLLLAGLAGCSGNSPPETAPADELFRWAMENFQEGDYGDATRGFESFLSRFSLDARADSAQYMLARSYMEDGQAETAAQEFLQMALTRPGSPLADDAQLGACRAFFESAPIIPRTQENSRRAVDECERLSQFFPESPLIAEAQEIIAKARERLARKSLHVARYYFNRGFYESANIYLETVLREYPGVSATPDVLGLLYRSYMELGFETEARSVRERLLTEFPESAAAQRVRQDGGSPGEEAPAAGGR